MAERRMFAKTIVLSDAFLDMPLSARCLYFTLGMLADDDGFVNAPRSVMRQCGASDDDMKLLVGKKFVLVFDSGVIVIKHWRINNYLQKDRYKETKYVEEKSTLSVDGNGIYHKDNSLPMYTDPVYTTDTDTVYTQDRLGKDRVRLGEDRLGEDNNSFFSEEENKKEENFDRDVEIGRYATMVKNFSGRGWETSGVYKLAASKGITAEEIDARLEAGT